MAREGALLLLRSSLFSEGRRREQTPEGFPSVVLRINILSLGHEKSVQATLNVNFSVSIQCLRQSELNAAISYQAREQHVPTRSLPTLKATELSV